MSDPTLVILAVLVSHWISDFVLQSHWMATNKSKNMDALLSHVAVYYVSMVVCTGTSFYLIFGSEGQLWGMLMLWWLLNGVAHLVVDYVTSRITSRLWSKGDYHNFFVVVGFDQLLHYACLFMTLDWMIGLI